MLVQYVAENENFAGLFTTKVIKSHVKLHVKSDAQKVNSLWLVQIHPVFLAWFGFRHPLSKFNFGHATSRLIDAISKLVIFLR